MGYNGEDSLKVVVDIETYPLDDAGVYLEPAEAPANYKDPAKIAEYVAQKNAENLSRAALDVDLCRIVALGWMREDEDTPTVVVMNGTELPEDGNERLALSMFWQALGQRVTVGYNTLGFDLPVLMRRSLYLGIGHPHVSLDRYRTNHIDLQQRMSFNGLLKFRSLSFYCKRFGIPCEDESTGADIGQFVKDGAWDLVAAHCRADVLKTRALAEKIGLLKAQPAMSEAAF